MNSRRTLVSLVLAVLAWQWAEAALVASLTGGRALQFVLPALAVAAVAGLVAVWVRPAIPRRVIALAVAGVLAELGMRLGAAIADGRLVEFTAWIVAIYAAWVAVAVVMVKARVKWMTPEMIEPCPVDEAIVGAAGDLRSPVERLSALGFAPATGVRVEHPPANPRAVFLHHTSDAARASVTAYSAQPPVVVIEIGQRDAAGRGMSVTDTAIIRFNPAFECDTVLRFPGMPADELWTTYRRLRQAVRDGAPWVPYAEGEVDAARAGIERQVEEYRRRGFLARNATSGGIPLTWLGALRFTLAAAWPWKFVADRTQVAQARRAAAAAGPD